jgi:phosphatidylserine/phosphatidylglycerophosphate/cardiolipin synthase-like enzyme
MENIWSKQNMKRSSQIILQAFFLLWISFSLNAQIQIVESVPAETNLGIEETGRTLEVWLDMINGAQQSIDIEIFYFSAREGEPLDQIVSALESAAERGVLIRIIADAKFASIYPETLDRLNVLENVEVRRIPFFNEMKGVQHGKYFIVDKKEIFLGSQNFDWRALKHIHELGIRIQNQKLAEFILQIFNLDWRLSKDAEYWGEIRNLLLPDSLIVNWKNPLKLEWRGESLSIYPTFTPKAYILSGMAFDETQILELIKKAKEEIHIQLLSYDPTHDGEYYPAIENALRNAAIRGVQVKLIVSDWNKQKPGVDFLKSMQVLPNIEVKFSTIPQYGGGFVPFARVEHCKYMVVDDSLTWIGTSNWAKNYFYASRNLGLVIKGKSVNSIVQKVFLKSWNGEYTYMVDPSADYKAPKVSE